MISGSCLIVGVFPLAITLYSHHKYSGFPSVVCESAAYKISGVFGYLILLVFMFWCIVSLTKVHDAYFVKTEMKLVLIVNVLLGVPGYILIFVEKEYYTGTYEF